MSMTTEPNAGQLESAPIATSRTASGIIAALRAGLRRYAAIMAALALYSLLALPPAPMQRHHVLEIYVQTASSRLALLLPQAWESVNAAMERTRARQAAMARIRNAAN